METSLNNIIFHISTFWKSQISKSVDTTRHKKCGTYFKLSNLKMWIIGSFGNLKIEKVNMLRRPKYENTSNVLLSQK